MSILLNAWKQFRAHPDVWFFYAFLLTFTLSIRKVLFFYPILGQFNEYTGIYLYLSDIFFILTIGLWIISILYNNYSNLSSAIHSFLRLETFVLPLVIAAWTFISISWASDTNLALFRSLKLAEFYLLYLYIAHNVPRGTFLRDIFRIIIALGFIQAIICIGQFFIQHSVGLFWLKESLISPNIDGVAKVMLFGHKFIRSYGLFPHPNILGGFLLASIILTWAYGKMFHACPVAQNCSIRNNSVATGVEHFFRGKTFINSILIIQVAALLFTFSKSAILALIIAVAYILYINVPHGTSYRMGAKYFWRYFITALVIVILLLSVLGFNIKSLLFKSLNERLLYLDVSRETIVANPILGVGMGQFVEGMQKYSSVFLANWQYQPVHNIFLLIWSELGIVGLVLFILFLFNLFHPGRNVPCLPAEEAGGTYIFIGISLGLVFIMLFDHYLWDIQQGQIMLWMVLGFLAGSKK